MDSSSKVSDASVRRRGQKLFSKVAKVQRHWEIQRDWKRGEMKRRRAVSRKNEKEAEEEREALGLKKEKVLVIYQEAFVHSLLNHSYKSCTECLALLWGTPHSCPLWMPCNKKSRKMKAPYCEGCRRLFGPRNISEEEKLRIIHWLMKGEHPELNNSNIENIDYENAAKSLKERAQDSFIKFPLYDHPSWTHLESKNDIKMELKQKNQGINDSDLESITESYINTFPGIIRKPIPNIDDFTTASGEELESLTIEQEGRDVFVGHRCSSRRRTIIGITYDHIIPLSIARFENNTHSINNLQIVSRCLNEVKENYNDFELERWLFQLLRTYEKRHPFNLN